MIENTSAAGSLKHHFLVASPWLSDPRFHGGVIYICEHSEDGALGLMINQPLGIHLGEILEQLDMQGGELDIPVYTGGPVQPERGFVLHSPGREWQHTARVTDEVSLTTSRDVLESIGQDDGPQEFLVALGYSGWGEGQLEEELGSNSWLTCPATDDVLFRTPIERRYEAVLELIGVDLSQLSDSVGHA
ncbi:MAG: YqgE/AlgH family protein [Marinobacter sp.]|uniref:YqgE/AlgH family protein n=1 Tax=unclassified Marinobacter TaxID=83889 RepID=UPI00273B2347|nr:MULTISPECIES: YqgE/AlgH family protein [unclassified Marinobacter]MDP4547748.1 YqgE/AlgH family protein [Marinobacter sp. MDS2]